MAYKNFGFGNKRRNKRRSNRRAGSKSTELRRLAYKMGQVQRGLENPDSLISASYEAGNTKHERSPRKTLF